MMRITGIDEVTVGVTDLTNAARFCRDFGLIETESAAEGAEFRTRDGSGLRLRAHEDSDLRPANVGGSTVREIVWRVTDASELDRIGAELSRDRDVQLGADGVLRACDDDDYSLAFRARQAPDVPPTPRRGLNTRAERRAPVRPRSISHIVIHTPQTDRAMEFYTSRLGFRPTDTFDEGKGVFLRPAGSADHHKLFLIAVERPLGLNHIAFEVEGFADVVSGGEQLVGKGWRSAWGPGRHILGSNFFWYFESPLGGQLEYTCDLDQVDDDWVEGAWPLSADTAAMYTLRYDPANLKGVENVARGVV